MYLYPIIYISLGLIFLSFSIYFFLKDYKEIVQYNLEGKKLILNLISILFSISTVVIAIFYFFIINNQL